MRFIIPLLAVCVQLYNRTFQIQKHIHSTLLILGFYELFETDAACRWRFGNHIFTTTKTAAMTVPPPRIRHDDDEIHWSGEENARLDSLACYVIRAVLFVLFSLVTPRVIPPPLWRKGDSPVPHKHRNP